MAMLRRVVQRGVKIYTRTGDQGVTGLHGKGRHPKTDLIFEVLGTNDELSSHIGLSRALIMKQDGLGVVAEQLNAIQQSIQTINARLASNVSVVAESDSLELEQWIDQLAAELPALKKFILPSGGVESAQLHVARAVCRRAERLLHKLHAGQDSTTTHPDATYINRLSDYLFTAARFVCKATSNQETVYAPSRL